MCELPLVCELSANRRLHHADGPALTYADGFAQYAWDGVLVERRIIEQPKSITVEQIEAEINAEIRRVMMAAVARNVMRAATSSGLSIPGVDGGGAKK